MIDIRYTIRLLGQLKRDTDSDRQWGGKCGGGDKGADVTHRVSVVPSAQFWGHSLRHEGLSAPDRQIDRFMDTSSFTPPNAYLRHYFRQGLYALFTAVRSRNKGSTQEKCSQICNLTSRNKARTKRDASKSFCGSFSAAASLTAAFHQFIVAPRPPSPRYPLVGALHKLQRHSFPS